MSLPSGLEWRSLSPRRAQRILLWSNHQQHQTLLRLLWAEAPEAAVTPERVRERRLSEELQRRASGRSA